MKLNEVTEPGFYTGELDTKRETIYEVTNNTDEEWLKETPEQKLLIDEWTYEYTDEDNRKHYEIYGGNLVAVVNAEPIDVIKITDTKYTVSGINGTHLSENKPTRLEIAEQQLEAYKMEAEEGKEINAELKAECERLKQGYAELTEIVSPYMDDFTGYNEELGGFDIVLCVKELMEQLDQLKAENDTYKKMLKDEDIQLTLTEIRSGERHLWYKKADKLSKTLAEVKEIAEHWRNEWISDPDERLGFEKILQKLSEVK